MTHDYWWPNMKQTIMDYIKGCTTCQSRKNHPTKTKPPLYPIPSESFTLPFTSIAMDFIVKLPTSNSYDTILTITDTFSKVSIFIPCKETTDAENTALLYTTYMLPHYGLPSWIISDRDPRFTATFTKELCWILRVDQNISTAYHPQTDGQSEWRNQCLEQYLRIFIDNHQNDWDQWLPLAQYTLNALPNATTKKAPFELIMGHIPQVHQTKQLTTLPTLNNRLEIINNTRKEAADALRPAQTLSTPSNFTPYCIGDWDWLDTKHLNTTHPTAKLAPKWHRPFLITKAISHVSYWLKLPSTWKIHNIFHASLLTPYKETTTNGQQYQEPMPDLVNGQPEWEVDQILGARRHRNQLQYLVRWKGFSKAHDSWEPLTHIKADDLIAEFYWKQPLAAHNINYKDPSPSLCITICSITMSTTSSPDSFPAPTPIISSPIPLIAPLLPSLTNTSLSDRIEDAPIPLTLEQWLLSSDEEVFETPGDMSEPGSPPPSPIPPPATPPATVPSVAQHKAQQTRSNAHLW